MYQSTPRCSRQGEQDTCKNTANIKFFHVCSHFKKYAYTSFSPSIVVQSASVFRYFSRNIYIFPHKFISVPSVIVVCHIIVFYCYLSIVTFNSPWTSKFICKDCSIINAQFFIITQLKKPAMGIKFIVFLYRCKSRSPKLLTVVCCGMFFLKF